MLILCFAQDPRDSNIRAQQKEGPLPDTAIYCRARVYKDLGRVKAPPKS